MRKTILLLAVFGLVGALWAADPFVGTWKLNVAKSKLPPSTQAPSKEEMRLIRELDVEQFENTQTGTRTDGAPISNKLIWPQKGGAVKFETALPEGVFAFATMSGPGDWYLTILQNGKQVEVFHDVVSKDGKTLHETIKGTDVKGKPFEGLLLFDKQ